MQGHVEFDLHHAQLAIVAKIWNIPSVDAFLSSGRSLWKELVAHMGLTNISSETYEDVKWFLKKYTYATIFGMNEENLTKGNTARINRLKKLGIKSAAKKVSGLDNDLAAFGVENAGEKFTSYPLIADLLAARDRMLKTIKNSIGMHNAYGQLIVVKPGFDERDVLAQVAQSYEMYLLNPILEYVKHNKEYMSISCQQHDGVSIKFHNNQYKQALIDDLVQGINNHCKSTGFNTWVDYEENEVAEIQPTHIQADLVDAALSQERSLPEIIVEASKEVIEQDLALTFEMVSGLSGEEIEIITERLALAKRSARNQEPFVSAFLKADCQIHRPKARMS